MAYNQFLTYLTAKERLTTKQSGNKKWFSTETSLIHTTDAFLKGIDDKKLTACVLLDMSKAFDSVDHQILLRKIQRVGASTSAIKWFNSYLTNRYQVECCVPQGSILGPLLFSIYLNDLPEVPRQCSTECYVDDTKLFVSLNYTTPKQIVQEMNKDLRLLNPDKTKLIVFGSRQMNSKLCEFHLSLLGRDISPVQSARNLGVILDPNLTFDNHILTTSVSGCIARLAQINRVKHCLDKNTLLTVIHASLQQNVLLFDCLGKYHK